MKIKIDFLIDILISGRQLKKNFLLKKKKTFS